MSDHVAIPRNYLQMSCKIFILGIFCRWRQRCEWYVRYFCICAQVFFAKKRLFWVANHPKIMVCKWDWEEVAVNIVFARKSVTFLPSCLCWQVSRKIYFTITNWYAIVQETTQLSDELPHIFIFQMKISMSLAIFNLCHRVNIAIAL